MSFAPFAMTWLGDDEHAPEGDSRIAGRLEGEHILVPLLDPTVPAITDQVGVAATLARTHGASLQVLNPIALPEQLSYEYREDVTDEAERQLLAWALDEVDERGTRAEGTFLYHRRLGRSLTRSIAAHDIDTVVLPGGTKPGLRPTVTERITTHAEADVIVVNGQPGYDEVTSILLPVAGGPHSGLATDVARRIAEDQDAWVDVLHVVEEDAPAHRRMAAEEYVEAARNRLAGFENVDTWILEADDVAEAIIEQSEYYSLTVLGAPTKGRLRQFVFGSTTDDVRANAKSLVLTGRNNSRRHDDLGK